MTTIQDYYKHARSLGSFRAIDCLRIARDAAALEWAAARRIAQYRGADAVCHESAYGSTQRLSFSIKVY